MMTFSPQLAPKDGVYYILLAVLIMLKSLNIYFRKSNHTLYLTLSISYRRVNPNLKGKDDWTPLEIAIQSGFFQIVNLLLEDKRV